MHVVNDNFNTEMILLCGKNIVKYNLFDCIFNKNRKQQGLRVLNFEPVPERFGGKQEQFQASQITDENLSNRPLCLRILYRNLFAAKFEKDAVNVKNMNQSGLSNVLLEDKDMINMDSNDYSTCATHPSLPVIFAVQKSKFFVYFSQLMNYRYYCSDIQQNYDSSCEIDRRKT
jgi:hypothetical protein